MRVLLRAFPVTYFTAKCPKHDCWVSVRVSESTDRSDRHTIGAQIVAMECEKGGKAADSNCSETWELSISGTGNITITH